MTATWTRILPGSSGERERGYRAIAEWLVASTPPGTTVAVRDFGALGYYSDLYIFDLTGAVLPLDTVRILKAGGIPAVLEATRPDYVVGRFPVPGAVFAPAYTVESTGHIASGAAITRQVIIYRLGWEEPP